ncbi:H(+)-transporting V1 sector ATPase subunit H [Orbilia blumenaviensis]|uniref:V-type proton ATPase subunit H n=1 Tax=Orbilia blumenaviensis TaxID=1796055 RepID=A0AAV9V1U8_9PEZI
MSLPPPAIISSLIQSIRARPIPWDHLQRTNVISEQELKLTKAVDKVGREKRVAIVEADLESYAALIVGDADGRAKGLLERSGKKVELVQYLLVLAVEICEDVPSFVAALNKHQDPYTHLMTLLDHTDAPIPIITSSLLTTLISASLLLPSSSRTEKPVKQALPTLFKYLATISSSSSSSASSSESAEWNLQDLAVQNYVLLLRNSFARMTFWQMGDETMRGLTGVVETAAAGSKGSRTTDVGSVANTSSSSASTSLLSGASSSGAGGAGLKQGGVNLQLLYHVLVAIWQLSFEEEIADELDEKYDLIPPLVHLLRCALKEKILRVCLAIFTNLIVKSPGPNLPSLLLSRLLPLLTTLKARKFTDPDLTGDLDTCLTSLEAFQLTQTNFDEYATEIRSGHLSWTPPHRNQDFWKKNARRIMEENNGELVQCLARVLKESEEKLVLAVAAHDVGVLVREVPEKRRVWDGVAVKARVMQLMGDSDPEVRYESLKAVQEFLRYAFGG